MNKVLNVIIAISYTLCDTVDACWLVSQQTLMLHEKCFFLWDNAIKHMAFSVKLHQQTSVMCACKIDSLLNMYELGDL